MNVPDSLKRISASVGERGHSSPADVEAVEAELARNPTSADLWIFRGNLIQIAEGGRWSLQDALESYRTALKYDPASAEAHEEIGHFLDAVEGKPAEAEPYFRKAIELGGGTTARQGLEQVLEELKGGAG